MQPIYNIPIPTEASPEVSTKDQGGGSKTCVELAALCDPEELLKLDPDSRYITFSFNRGYFERAVNPKHDDAVKNTSSKKVVEICEKYKKGEELTEDEKKLK